MLSDSVSVLSGSGLLINYIRCKESEMQKLFERIDMVGAERDAIRTANGTLKCLSASSHREMVPPSFWMRAMVSYSLPGKWFFFEAAMNGSRQFSGGSTSYDLARLEVSTKPHSAWRKSEAWRF